MSTLDAAQAQVSTTNTTDEDKNKSTGGGPVQTPGAVAPGGRVANYSSGEQSGSTGSGRFTNLQKYIGANQGAGDQLSQGIGQKVNAANDASKKEADTSASAVRDGIQSAQGKLSTGNDYLKQVNDKGFDAQKFLAPPQAQGATTGAPAPAAGTTPAAPAYDQNKLQDFTNFRTGSAIDEALLNKENQAAQTNYLNYQNQVQNQLNQTATDTGRYQLLKNAFGGGNVYQNPYSTGQQRLDQLFLQSGGNNGIGQLQNQLRQTNAGATNQIADLQGNVTNNINDITSKEANIANGLQTGTNDMTNKYVGDIAGTADQVNAQRADDQKWVTDQYTKLQAGQPVDEKFAKMLGLNDGQSLYHSLNNQNVNSLFDFNPANLTVGAGDDTAKANAIANKQQRQYYDALTKLSGATDGWSATGPASAYTNKNTINDMLTKGTDDYNKAIQNASGNYTWGSGAIVPINSQLGLNNAGTALAGISSDGANKLQGLGRSTFNNFSGQAQYDLPKLQSLGFSPEDAQKIFNASQQASVQGGPAAGEYAANAQYGSTQDALNQLINQGFTNRVKINPTGLESDKNFGVT